MRAHQTVVAAKFTVMRRLVVTEHRESHVVAALSPQLPNLGVVNSVVSDEQHTRFIARITTLFELFARRGRPLVACLPRVTCEASHDKLPLFAADEFERTVARAAKHEFVE